MKGTFAPVLIALPPVLGLAGMALFFVFSGEREPEPEVEETALKFHLLERTEWAEASEGPVYPKALLKLNGKRVIISGHMTETPGSERQDHFQRFRLLEKAPRMMLRPPAANEGVFVEQRWPEDSDRPAAEHFPRVDGGLTVRGVLRLVGYEGDNPGLAAGYWFAIEDALIDPHKPAATADLADP